MNSVLACIWAICVWEFVEKLKCCNANVTDFLHTVTWYNNIFNDMTGIQRDYLLFDWRLDNTDKVLELQANVKADLVRCVINDTNFIIIANGIKNWAYYIE